MFFCCINAWRWLVEEYFIVNTQFNIGFQKWTRVWLDSIDVLMDFDFDDKKEILGTYDKILIVYIDE